MNRIKQEDVTVGARFKENRKPTATVFDNSMIIAIQPDEVIVTDRFFQKHGNVEIDMVLYTVKSTGLLEGKSIEGFIDNFRNLQKVTHCWSCRRTLDQNKEKLEECIVCGGIKCPDDDNCLCTNPVYGDHYKPSKGRITKRE